MHQRHVMLRAENEEAIVPTRQLPGNSSLEHLKNQARALQREVRAAQDQRFLDLARRFHDDWPLLLVAELHGQIIGVAFAFRRHGPGDPAATLRNVAVLPAYQDQGIERRLVEAIEQAAASVGVISLHLGGATGDERDFYLALGYHGRHAGGLMSKELPRPRRSSAGPRPLP
jgi:GNAT superfamily N-acetyltransferase